MRLNLLRSQWTLLLSWSSLLFLPVIVPPQERTGVQMIMIQDDPMPTGADKPLRITGDPHKVQVCPLETQTWSDAAALSLTFTPPKNFFFIIVSNLHLMII